MPLLNLVSGTPSWQADSMVILRDHMEWILSDGRPWWQEWKYRTALGLSLMWVLVVLGAFGGHLKTALIWLCFSNFWCPHFIQTVFPPSSFHSLSRALGVASCHHDICGTRKKCSWQCGRGKLWITYVKIRDFFPPTKSRKYVESEREGSINIALIFGNCLAQTMIISKQNVSSLAKGQLSPQQSLKKLTKNERQRSWKAA